MYSKDRRSTDGGKTWSDSEIAVDFIHKDYSDRVFKGTKCLKEMTIQSEPPKMMMGGFMSSFLTVGLKSDLILAGYAQDNDINDFVTSIEVFWDGIPLGIKLTPDGNSPAQEKTDGIFYCIYPVNPGQADQLLIQLYAKDYFGNLSDPWPFLTVKSE